MTEPNYILNTPLPKELDFKALKEEGLAYIQEHSSYEWTNLNPSDPGVTILDQLCYALTELGYCTNFPIADILTNANGKLPIENQFYLPEHILTTAPITTTDYIKYIIDAIPEVDNVVIEPIKSKSLAIGGKYRVFLKLVDNTATSDEQKKICRSVFLLLISSRNLGEFFLFPKILTPKTFNTHGQLIIEEGYDQNAVLAEVHANINNYIFPKVVQTGYDTLMEEGITTDQIFNGPLLQHGWIPDSSLQAKKDVIRAFEIREVIASVEGVKSVSNLYFKEKRKKKKDKTKAKKKSHKKYKIKAGKRKIIVLEVVRSKADRGLMKLGNAVGTLKNISSLRVREIAKVKPQKDQINTVDAIKIAPNPPQGKFRDINTYYSIQNTFPEI